MLTDIPKKKKKKKEAWLCSREYNSIASLEYAITCKMNSNQP